jgi:putative nucleotidyltransferase with HDIG domain
LRSCIFFLRDGDLVSHISKTVAGKVAKLRDQHSGTGLREACSGFFRALFVCVLRLEWRLRRFASNVVVSLYCNARIQGQFVNMSGNITREDAWNLLSEFTQSESLRKHALAVEACMRAYARKFGADEELWGIVGLIHDFDYEKYPSLQDHPYRGNEILQQRGYSEEIRRAILSHADYTGVSRDTPLEKSLFACDELAGFITAATLVKPSKSLADLEAKSVRKKMKDKAFARSVSRDDIIDGASALGVDLDEHITFCIEAMKGIAEQLGLAGNTQAGLRPSDASSE